MRSAPGGRAAAVLLALGIVGALVGWLPAPLVAPTPPAGADPPVDCSVGVIVAVNSSPWKSVVDAVCDLAPIPATAAGALQTAGFSPTGVASYGLAFICQIDGDPPDDSCQTTPPGDAYWSLWYADNGQDTWTYSTSGAMSLEPQAGSVEYWVFGGQSGNGQPTGPTPDTVRTATQLSVTPPTPPPAPPATEPAGAPAPAGAATAGSAPETMATMPAGQGSSGAASTTTPTTTPAASAGSSPQPATSHHSSGSPSAGRSDGRTPPTVSGGTKTSGRPGPVKIVSVAPALARHRPSSPVGLIIGGIAVAGLAGAAGFIAVRRRRAD